MTHSHNTIPRPLTDIRREEGDMFPLLCKVVTIMYMTMITYSRPKAKARTTSLQTQNCISEGCVEHKSEIS